MRSCGRDQAEALRLWAKSQALPIVAIGDFNFDYSFVEQTGNDAFAEFLKDDTWKWVKPEPLVDTNWADHDGDGERRLPGFDAGLRVRGGCGEGLGRQVQRRRSSR